MGLLYESHPNPVVSWWHSWSAIDICVSEPDMHFVTYKQKSLVTRIGCSHKDDQCVHHSPLVTSRGVHNAYHTVPHV
jgi:hypothetical protein